MMQVNEQVSKATFKYINITAVSSLNSKQGANSIRSDFQNFIIAMMPNGNAKPEFKAKIIVNLQLSNLFKSLLIMTKDLTLDEAKNLLTKGYKIKHYFFIPGEFIHLVKGKLTDEDGNHFTSVEFWAIRKDGNWLNGWSIFEEETE